MSIGAAFDLSHINDMSIIEIVGTDLNMIIKGESSFLKGAKSAEKTASNTAERNAIRKLDNALNNVDNAALQNTFCVIKAKKAVTVE
jgi:hypothetical protein